MIIIRVTFDHFWSQHYFRVAWAVAKFELSLKLNPLNDKKAGKIIWYALIFDFFLICKGMQIRSTFSNDRHP